jgi:hypothetical protein
MTEADSTQIDQIFRLLLDVILPNLKSIHASQAEQRAQSQRLGESITEFRAEMEMLFATLRAETEAVRLEIDDSLFALRESLRAELHLGKGKSLVH